MNPNALLLEWQIGIRIAVVAHYSSAKLFESYHRRLGWPLVILSAIAGTSVVASMNEAHGGWEKPVSVILSMLVTVLASLQTFLRFSELAEKHKLAATELSKLRRQLEETLSLIPAGAMATQADMDPIRTKWDELSTNAPPIPSRIYRQSQMYVNTQPAGANVPNNNPPAPVVPIGSGKPNPALAAPAAPANIPVLPTAPPAAPASNPLGAASIPVVQPPVETK